MDDSIEIEGERIRLQFVKKPWIKNSYLKFDEDRLVVVGRNESMMQKVVMRHKPWISKHYRQIKNSIRIFDSNSLLYDSKKYSVDYVNYSGKPKADIREDSLIIYAKNYDAAEKFIDRMIRDGTIRGASELALNKAKQIGESFSEVRARRCRKWGVCRSDRTITFNYCISMLPKALQDYIVSHEVAHLKEMNHSPRFWNVVALLCPEYKQLRKELRRYDSIRRRIYQSDLENAV